VLDVFAGDLNECEQAVWNCLSHEFVDFDALAIRSGLDVSKLNAGICFFELRGLVKSSHGRYARLARIAPPDADVSKLPVQQFKEFVGAIHHRIGRRSIQWYLAAFWCFNDRIRWGPGKLLEACIRAAPISRAELRKYVPPPFVKMLPIC